MHPQNLIARQEPNPFWRGGLGRLPSLLVEKLCQGVAALGPAGPLLRAPLGEAARLATGAAIGGAAGRRHARRGLARAARRIQWVALVVAHSRWAARRRRRRRVRIAAATHAFRRAGRQALERAAAAAAPHLPPHLPPLNAFIEFGESERAEWLSEALASVWGTVDATFNTLIRALIEPMLHELRPRGVSRMGLDNFSLGAVPPQVTGVQTVVVGASAATDGKEGGKDGRRTERAEGGAPEDAGDGVESEGELLLFVSVRWRGEPSIAFSVRGPAIYANVAPLSVHVTNLRVEGTLRVRLAPLLSRLPLVGGLSMTFPEMPAIDYDLAAVPAPGLPRVHLDAFFGLNEALRHVLRQVVRDTIVSPKVLPVVFDRSTKSREQAIARMLSTHPLGYLHIRVDRARGLRTSDRGGTSDPYLEAGLTSRRAHHSRRAALDRGAMRSEVCPQTLDPERRFRASFPVFNPSVEALVVRVFDWDRFNRDDLLGFVRLDVAGVARQPGKEVEGWYVLTPPSGSTGKIMGRVRGLARGQSRSIRGEVYMRCVYTATAAVPANEVVEHQLATESFYAPLIAKDLPKDSGEGMLEDTPPRSPSRRMVSSAAPPLTPRSTTATFAGKVLHSPKAKSLSRPDTSTPSPPSLASTLTPAKDARQRRENEVACPLARGVARALGIPDEFHLGRALAAHDAAMLPLTLSPQQLASLARAIAPSALPAWTASTAWERAHWMDEIICTLWPLLRVAVRAEVRRLNDLGLVSLMRGMEHDAAADAILRPQLSVELGELPPTVEALHASTSPSGTGSSGGSHAQVCLEVWLRLAGDLRVGARVAPLGNPLAACGVEVSEVLLLAKARIRLHPLLAAPPVVGGVSLSLLEDPTVDACVGVRVCGLLPPLPLLDLPGAWLCKRVLMRTLVRRALCEPAFAHVPLVDPADDDMAALIGGRAAAAAGVLVVEVMSAADLIITDVLKGSSDPYVVVMIDAAEGLSAGVAPPYARRARATKTMARTLNPRWDASQHSGDGIRSDKGARLTFEVPASSRALRVWVGVFDRDVGGAVCSSTLAACGLRGVYERLERTAAYNRGAELEALVSEAAAKEEIDAYDHLTTIPWSRAARKIAGSVSAVARAIRRRVQWRAGTKAKGATKSKHRDGTAGSKRSRLLKGAGGSMENIQSVLRDVRFLPYGKCTPREMIDEETIKSGSDFMGITPVDIGVIGKDTPAIGREVRTHRLVGVKHGSVTLATSFKPFVSSRAARSDSPARTDGEMRGTLFVELVRGKRLSSSWVPDRSLNPEVVLTLASDRFKSESAEGSNCYWRQTFQFNNITRTELSQNLHVLVRHRPDRALAGAWSWLAGAICARSGGRDIGSASCSSLLDVTQSSGGDVALDLRAADGSSAGTVYLHLQWRTLS